MTKSELRKLYLEKRVALTESEFTDRSSKILKNFFLAVDLSSIGVLHTFLPINKNKEPDTLRIIKDMQERFPLIQVSIPRVSAEHGELENFYWEGQHQIKINKWGIPEPQQGLRTPTEKIDMVIVPLLVFDLEGHRVGYGKGYYDRFLAQCRKDCKKIGLSFFPPIEMIGSRENHDQTLEMVITPEKSFRFQSH